jgi:hypothetical protein
VSRAGDFPGPFDMPIWQVFAPFRPGCLKLKVQVFAKEPFKQVLELKKKFAENVGHLGQADLYIRPVRLSESPRIVVRGSLPSGLDTIFKPKPKLKHICQGQGFFSAPFFVPPSPIRIQGMENCRLSRFQLSPSGQSCLWAVRDRKLRANLGKGGGFEPTTICPRGGCAAMPRLLTRVEN